MIKKWLQPISFAKNVLFLSWECWINTWNAFAKIEVDIVFKLEMSSISFA